MLAWFESVVGPQYASALMWTLAALFGLLVLLILIRVIRGLTFGTFVVGGRNRKTRLAVMDATAVDSHRRLVLVRRDDVEHLILIGGPSDVVVEQNIRVMASARIPVSEAPHDHALPPQPMEAPRMQAPVERAVAPVAPPRPAPAPVQTQPPRQTAPSVAPATPYKTQPPVSTPQAYQPQPQRPAPTMPPVSVAPQQPVAAQAMAPVQPRPVAPPVQNPVPPVVARPTVSPPVRNDLDDALLKELEISLESDHARPASGTRPSDDSADKAVSKLMSDLAAKR